MNNKEKLTIFSNKLYPIYYGLSGDLIFFVGIYTLFLNQVKLLSFAQIMSFTMYSSIAYLLFQIPILWLVKKLGNNASIRVGMSLLVLANIILITAQGYILNLIGFTIYVLSYQFKAVDPIILRNNLLKENKEHLFSSIVAKGKFVYALASMIVILFSGMIFDYNNILPMYLSLATTVLLLIFTFFIKDETQTENKQNKNTEEVQNLKMANKLVDFKHFFKKNALIIILISVLSFTFMGFIGIGQTNGKLILQEVGLNATYLTICVFVGRITRILSNLIYPYVYKIFKNNLGIILSIITVLSFLIMSTAALFVSNFILKIIIITIGIALHGFLRDPFQLLIQDLTFEHFSKKDRINIIFLEGATIRLGSLIVSALTTVLFINMSVAMSVLVITPICLITFIPSIILAIKFKS